MNREFILDRGGCRAEYLTRAGCTLKRTDWSALAYALMSSHLHWALVAGDDPLAKFAKSLNAGFAGWWNRSSLRTGPVFADRPRAIECEASVVAILIAYIHNNPVRGHVVADPADSTWTSHRAYIGLDRSPPWLDVERGLELCGFSSDAEGRARFHEFVVSRRGETRSEALSALRVNDVRVAVRRRFKTAELGHLRVDLESGEPRLEAPIMLAKFAPQRAALSAPIVIDRVCAAFGVPPSELRMRHRDASRIRRLALLVWYEGLSLPQIEMACALGLARSTASELIARASKRDQERAKQFARDLLGELTARLTG